MPTKPASAKQRKPPDRILVSRLKMAYSSRLVREWLDDPKDVLSSKTQERHVTASWVKKSLAWNRGRVRFFYDKLICGEDIDPIEIDNRCSMAGNFVSWGGPYIEDGHHRFAATILARKRYIKAHMSGLLTTHRWLRGEVPLRPIPREIAC